MVSRDRSSAVYKGTEGNLLGGDNGAILYLDGGGGYTTVDLPDFIELYTKR